MFWVYGRLSSLVLFYVCINSGLFLYVISVVDMSYSEVDLDSHGTALEYMACGL